MTLLRTHEGMTGITLPLNKGPRRMFMAILQQSNFGAGITEQNSQSQATTGSQGYQSLFTQEQPRPSSAIPQDETQFPPLAPSLRPWIEQQVHLLSLLRMRLNVQSFDVTLYWL